MATTKTIEDLSPPANDVQPKPVIRSLARKLAEVMGELERIPKTGTNPNFHYKFAEENVIVEKVRDLLSARKIILLPSVVDHKRTELQTRNGTTGLTTVLLEFTWIDGDSGETLTQRIVGEATDTQDKGVYKAYTGAVKYLLMKTFLLPTGDDPEYDQESPSRGGFERASELTPAPKSTSSATGASSSPSPPKTQKPAPPASAPTPRTDRSTAGTGEVCDYPNCGKPIDDRVAEYSQSHFGKRLCLPHQRASQK